MTTFQDQPPQSRRAARESERAVQTDSGVDYTAQFDQPSESTTPPSGRRARSDSPANLFEVPNAEPLTYSTQAREPQTPPAASAPSDAEQGFRVRDFSPEGRRSAAYPSQPAAPTNLDYRTLAGPGLEHPAEAQVPAPAAWQPPPSSPPEPAQPMSRREARAMREAADAAAGVVPLVEPELPTAAPTALTNAMAEFEALTRAAPPPVAEVTEPPRVESFITPDPEPETYTTRIPGPAAAQRVDDVPPPTGAFAFLPPVVEPVVEPEPEALVEPEPVAVVEPEPVALVEPRAEPEAVAQPEPAPLFSSHPSNVFQQFAAPAPDPVAEIVESPEPVQPSPESAAASAWPFTGLQPTIPVEETVEQPPAWAIPTPAAVTEPEPLVRETYTPPVGHWSRQADLDDENDVFENTLSREVGGSNVSTATSALILPNIPQANDFGSLINGTGEILITGTIDLPQSLGTMGGDSRRYDDPSVDHMFDAFDGEVVSNDSAPVRAIRAVSTHTSSRGVIQAAKPQGNRVLLTAAIITVSVLVVGVVGLLAAYIITGMN